MLTPPARRRDYRAEQEAIGNLIAIAAPILALVVAMIFGP